MKRILILVFLISHSLIAQIEQISSVNVGAYVDHTIVPLSPQSNLSHSQTIYYKDQLQFRGYISEISYFNVFSNYTTTDVPVDPANLTIKLGTTDLEEFGDGVSFVPEVELTEMTGILRSTSVYEVRYTFETPFYYDGTQNLVIDVEDLNPGASQSALDGYRGVENFGNPPKRSIISLTTNFDDGSSQSSVQKINSYPQTKFYGSLERCYSISVTSHSNVMSTSADAELLYDSNVTAVRYNLTQGDDAIPETYLTTTDQVINYTGLLPAQKYYTHVKSDCDEIASSYRSYSFTTRSTLISAPHTIDFEGEFLRDYVTSPEMPNGIEISTEGASNSINGIKMYGRTYPAWTSWYDYGDPFEENDDYIRTVSMDIDLVSSLNPVFQFDLKQPTYESYFRVLVSDFQNDYVLSGIEQGPVYQTINGALDDFRKVVVDLSDYVGQTITLKLQHVSKSFSRISYIDNLELLENTCLFQPTINAVETENSISVNWDSTQAEHELFITSYNESQVGESILETNLNHEFTGLNLATPYEVYVRSLCASNVSPFVKKHITTKTTPIELPFFNYLNSSVINGDLFAIQYQDAAEYSFLNGQNIVLHQRNSDQQWVGGDATTESQAWNDNIDFVTGLKYRVNATSVNSLNMIVSFRQYHAYNANPTHSWFRVLINGTQVGPSYNPVTKNSDPITNLNIDLGPYTGGVIDVELQQVGRSLSFSGGGISGDGTLITALDISGTLSNTEDSISELISVYPNPAQNELNINTTLMIDSILVFDVNGRLLTNITTNSTLDNFIVDISNFSKGLYFLKINTQRAHHIQKFIKN